MRVCRAGRPANFVSLFDFEGDGDLDAAVYYARRYEIVYVNDGTGRFAPLGPPISGVAYWGDLDGDRDADAVVHRVEGGYVILRNVGDGALAHGISDPRHPRFLRRFLAGAM